MAIPKIFHPVKPQDFTLNTIVTHKRFQLESGSVATTSSGYYLWNAIYTGVPTPIGTAKTSNDPTNSIDNSYQAVIWKSIDAQYYRFPYDSYATLEHSNERFTQKFLNISASVLRMPYFDFGEGIKPGSVHMTNSFYGLNLRDDQNGNLYDVSINTGSFATRYNLVGYWGFNNEFRKFKSIDNSVFGNRNIISCGEINYKSFTFQPNESSIAKNIVLHPGVLINSTASGFCAGFIGSSITTRNRDEFNFDSNQDFTISFWLNAIYDDQNNVSQSYNQVISKKGTIWKQTFGKQKKFQNDIVVEVDHVSSSFVDESTNIYPYDFRLYNNTAAAGLQNKLEFRRSNGIDTLVLTASLGITLETEFNHYAVVKSGSQITFYRNGIVSSTGTDVKSTPVNRHAIVFGADNQNFQNYFEGHLDEIRFYDRAFPQSTIQTLADNSNQSMYQSAVVGNVFYRRGKVVLSPFDKKYLNFFTQNWNLKYRGTHTIYEYETLIRIKKGSFNLSLNPTARISPYSDLLINEMTGSQNDTGALLPYCTTIGLYNDKQELMAVAKLGQPLQMREDVDLNISIKWDV